MANTFTFDEFLVYINELPSKFQKAAPEINMEVAKSLQRRIRTRAPMGETGSLKDIQIESRGENIVLTGPNHWFFVNAGMVPPRWLPLNVIDMHRKHPGGTAGQKLNIPKEQITGWFMPSRTPRKGKGFVDNSIESLQQDMPRIVEMELKKVFQK